MRRVVWLSLVLGIFTQFVVAAIPAMAAPSYSLVRSFGTGRGLATDTVGNVYVADNANSRIQKFNSNGTLLTSWGTPGTADGQFRFLQLVAADGCGNVYVTDAPERADMTYRMQKFDSNGVFVTSWNVNPDVIGLGNDTQGIAVYGCQYVYVADTSGRIQKFDTNGVLLTRWGTFGGGNGPLSEGTGLAVDRSGNVVVADRDNSRIQVFDASGAFLGKWGTLGTGDGQFMNPLGVVVTPPGTSTLPTQTTSGSKNSIPVAHS